MVTTSLRQRMRQAMRIRNISPRTERIYIDLVARFALHFHRSPDRLGLPEIEQYLFFLRDVKEGLVLLVQSDASALCASSIST